jgi:hypothetical protein
MMTVHWSHKEERFWIRNGEGVLWFDTEARAEAGLRQLEDNALVEKEISLIANYFRKMGKKQVAAAIENGDYKKNES